MDGYPMPIANVLVDAASRHKDVVVLSLVESETDQEFRWDDIQQKAFDEIKEYMKSLPVLIPPQRGKPFKLYMSADDHTIGSPLMQEFEGKE